MELLFFATRPVRKESRSLLEISPIRHALSNEDSKSSNGASHQDTKSMIYLSAFAKDHGF